MSNPIAIVISDIHYNLQMLELADDAMRQAIAKSKELGILLIVAGDLHDSKANMRAECVNAMIKTFNKSNDCTIIRGNHDSINERSSQHALNFLRVRNIVAGRPFYMGKNLYLIPYYHDPDELRKELKQIPKGSTLIMHQGIQGSNSGEYIQDKSAINPEDVAGMRVISGHYHTRQNIKLPDGGLWSYIGNPYTLNFAESNDPEKGYRILTDDGTLEFVPTNLRKHVVLNIEYVPLSGMWQITGKVPIEDVREEDLVLVKVKGTKEELSKATKQFISKLIYRENFRLDLIPITSERGAHVSPVLGNTDLLDSLIDSTNTTENCKLRLKQSWRDLV